jgi:LysR family transcriptional regulator, carnitine catabolism transcriptional activator
MEMGQLEAFDRVARDGNFTRAAETLGLTQPAVSTRISLLESELGGQLFERRGRQLFLTSLGERFLPYAQRLLALRDDGLQAVKDFHAGVTGQVKIAAPTPFLLSYLIDTLSHFRHEHSAVDILIRERNKTTIFDMLPDNTITLGLVNAPVFARNIVQLLRLRDPIVPIVGTTHFLARYGNQTIYMEDLYEHTVFRVSMFPQMTAFIDEVAEHARLGSGGAIIAVPMVMARRLVLMGQGMTFLPTSYVRALIDSGDFVQLTIEDMPPLYSEPVLIAFRNRELDDAHQAFIDVLKRQWNHLLVE